MRSVPLWILTAATLFQSVTGELFGIDVLVYSSPTSDEQIVIDIEPEATVAELQYVLDGLLGEEGQWSLVATRRCPNDRQFCPPNPQAGYQWDIANGARDFSYIPNQDDKNNIAYVVKTLANKNEASLLFYKSTIESCGNKVNHVHPLKFLQVIFSDEELKVGMRNIRKKSLVWKSFRGGIVDSLSDETNVNNMREEYLPEFAASIGIDPNIIAPLYQQRNWREFVEALVTHVPRKEDKRRYDF
jgi:hypothetical protein